MDGYSGMVRAKRVFKGNIYLAQLGGKVRGIIGKDKVEDRHLSAVIWWVHVVV